VVVSKYCTTEGLIYALRNHEYKYYRRLAAQLLGEREAIEALPQLCDALEDPEEVVQSGTAEALAIIGNATIFERLMNNLESPRPRVRQYSAYVLGQAAKRLGSTGGFNVVETLESAAGDRNNLVRVEVIYALYELGYSSSTDIFIAGLKDEEAGVRRHSANALGRARGRAAELALAEAFEEETDQDVRRSVATALSGFGSGTAIDTLLRSLPFESEPVRVDIAAKLAETGTPRAVRVLADLVTSDRSPRVRTNAAVGLLRAKDPSTVPALIDALKDRVSTVRVPASEALIELADESIMDNLIDAMDDPNATVADNAARAIVRIHSLAAVPELIQMLDSANTGAVGRAIAVLEGLTYRPYGNNTQEWKTWYEENFETGD
jgi:HEAT repeat protein